MKAAGDWSFTTGNVAKPDTESDAGDDDEGDFETAGECGTTKVSDVEHMSAMGGRHRVDRSMAPSHIIHQRRSDVGDRRLVAAPVSKVHTPPSYEKQLTDITRVIPNVECFYLQSIT